MRCCINHCCYNRIQLYLSLSIFWVLIIHCWKNANGECGCLHPQIKKCSRAHNKVGCERSICYHVWCQQWLVDLNDFNFQLAMWLGQSLLCDCVLCFLSCGHDWHCDIFCCLLLGGHHQTGVCWQSLSAKSV